MNLLQMGTAASHAKKWALNVKWQQRKQNPLKPKEDDPRIAELKRQAADQRRGQKISSIHTKLLAGERLTPEDLAYLRDNSPELYDKAVKLEKEREEYKRELEKCRSKEDVEKLNRRKLTDFCAEAKVVSSNPNIPRDKKKDLLEFIYMRMVGAMNELAEFKQTSRYQNLPEKSDEESWEKSRLYPVKKAEKHLSPPYSTQKDKDIAEELAELFSEFLDLTHNRTQGPTEKAKAAGNDARTYDAQGRYSTYTTDVRLDASVQA